MADMLIPQEEPASDYADGRPGSLYGCRHLQSNGDCGNYAQRPAMCRDYPNQGVYRLHAGCAFPGCTWSAVNDQKIGRLRSDEAYAQSAHVFLNGREVTGCYLAADDRAGYVRLPKLSEQGGVCLMPDGITVQEDVVYGRVVIDLVQTIAGGE